ncbi:MAG: deoxyhypusine synthase family protein [Candidatus Aminicenantes bacterium]|nr:deoxyhypusine synthase family protein [Candidatus Aminicenantes bacterium]
MRKYNKFSDGFDKGLEPLKPLDIAKCRSALELVKEMKDTAFGGRALGEAHEVLYKMISDPDCFVVGTFSGAMTIAKMGLLVCEMIDRKMLDAVVSTGALMAHGFVESVGYSHFKCDPYVDDVDYYKSGFNRVYDTIELEKNLDDIETIIKDVLNKWDKSKPLSSVTFCEELGRYLLKTTKGRGLLKSAAANNIPVYIPAFTDSELGIDVGVFRRRQKKKNMPLIDFDPFIDMDDYAERIMKSRKIGIFTIGGGVPRNWAQQVAPYIDIINHKLGEKFPQKRFSYGVRICPEPVHWGGLSGCTYKEGVSWGKFIPKTEGGMWAEVMADATIAWPLLLRSVIERMESGK